MSYLRITPDLNLTLYWMIEQAKYEGRWMCDSVDHNEPEGCSNPECFKYHKCKVALQVAPRSTTQT